MRLPLLFPLLAGGLLVSCGGGSKVTLQGFLNPAGSPSTQTVPINPSVTILGRDPSEFSVSFAGQATPAWPLQFSIGGIPKEEWVIFQVKGGDLYGAASFPIWSDPNQLINLGALTTNAVTAIKTQVGPLAGGISTNTGIIVGIVAPSGGNPFSRVSLVNRIDGKTTTAKGPYYFNDSDTVVYPASGFQDQIGTYVFVNVPPGDYLVKFIGTQQVEAEVIVIRDQVSFGYEIP